MHLKKILGTVAVGAAAIGLTAAVAVGDGHRFDGPMKFSPIAGSAYG